MHAWIFVAVIVATGEVRDGTIVVLENSNPIVETITKSEVTHVAMVLNDGGRPWVYEATPGNVRKLPLSDYYAEIGALNRGRKPEKFVRMKLYPPALEYTDVEQAQMKAFLANQLGRRYSVRGYVREKPGDGVHCAELVSTVLGQTGRFAFPPNYSVSPASLVAKLQTTHGPPVSVPLPLGHTDDSWCQRASKWWSAKSDWCSWACWESWTFCR